jgi:hypothetical protein
MAKRPRNTGGPYTPKRGRHAGEHFRTYRDYRDTIAREKGFSSLSVQQRARRTSGLSPPEQRVAERAWKAVALKRSDRNLSKGEAARRAGTTPNAIERYVGQAWPSSVTRWSFLTKDGVITLEVTDKRTKSNLGRYDNALRKYIDGKGDADLMAFRGRYIRVNGQRYEFLTDTNRINELGDAGELRIEYASGDAA